MRRERRTGRWLTPLAWFVGCVATFAGAREANAQHPNRDDYVPHPVRSDYSLSAGWWSASGAGSTFPWLLRGTNEATDSVFVDFEVPWTFTVDTESDPVGAVGNPTLAVRYATHQAPVAWTVGGGISAPMGAIDDLEYRVALGLGASATTVERPYDFAVATLPIHVRGGVEVRPAEFLFIRGKVEPAVFIPVESNFDVAVGSYQRLELEARAPKGFGGGAAMRSLAIYTDTLDHIQLAAEVFGSYDDEEDFFARLGVVLALDEVLGFGFDEGKVFAGFATIGSYFEET